MSAKPVVTPKPSGLKNPFAGPLSCLGLGLGTGSSPRSPSYVLTMWHLHKLPEGPLDVAADCERQNPERKRHRESQRE